MANVSIKCNGKECLLSCEDGQEEQLEELLIQINQKFNKIKNELGNLGDTVDVLLVGGGGGGLGDDDAGGGLGDEAPADDAGGGADLTGEPVDFEEPAEDPAA